MSLVTRLVAFSLRQVVKAGESLFIPVQVVRAGEKAIDWIERYCKDPTQALPKAILTANDQLWRAVELSLAGDQLTGKVRLWLASGRTKGVAVPLQAMANAKTPAFRRDCLLELRQARRAGDLTPAFGAPLAALSQGFAPAGTPEALLAAAQRLIADGARELGAGYPRLTELLAEPTPDGPVLVLVFGYFLRQAVGDDPGLREDLNFRLLNQVWQGQAEGIEALQQGLMEHREAIGAELDRLEERLWQEFTQLRQGQAEQQAMLEEILRRLPPEARRGSLSPKLSSVLRGAEDQRIFQEFLRRLRELPVESRTAALQEALGRFGMAIGDFATAEGLFEQAAHQTPDQAARAEAHYHAFRALLEQHHWAPALEALLAAARLDPERFEPFPLGKYRPERILGAGGFGVAFLCRHVHLGHSLVLKTLHRQDLDQEVSDIFREGRTLKELRHPGIIAVEDGDYADRARQRSYLAMEYFAGDSLETWLEQHDALTLPDALRLAHPIAEALHAAHRAGVLHRDVKPANILVKQERGQWTVKLIDFGLALRRQMLQEGIQAAQPHGSVMAESIGGTYQFSAPEQMGLTSAPVGPYSDVYAFGKTLGFALCGHTDLKRKDWKRLEEENAPFAELLEHCLEEEPKARLPDFAAVLERLRALDPEVEQQRQRRQQQEEQARRQQEQEKQAEARRRAEEAEQQHERAERARREEEERKRRQLQEEQDRRQREQAEAERKRAATTGSGFKFPWKAVKWMFIIVLLLGIAAVFVNRDANKMVRNAITHVWERAKGNTVMEITVPMEGRAEIPSPGPGTWRISIKDDRLYVCKVPGTEGHFSGLISENSRDTSEPSVLRFPGKKGFALVFQTGSQKAQGGETFTMHSDPLFVSVNTHKDGCVFTSGKKEIITTVVFEPL